MNILRRPNVMARTGLSGPTIWRLERAGYFPARVQLAPNSVGWFEADIDAWLASRQRVKTSKPVKASARTLLDAG